MDISARSRACSFVGWFGEDRGEACYNVGGERDGGGLGSIANGRSSKYRISTQFTTADLMLGTCQRSCQRCLADMNSEMKNFFVSPDLRIERRGIY
jgi:hypothetical protein